MRSPGLPPIISTLAASAIGFTLAFLVASAIAAPAAHAVSFEAPFVAPQRMTVVTGSSYHQHYAGAMEDDRYAVDLSDGCRSGIPVVSPFAGTVIRARWTTRGNQIIVAADGNSLFVGMAHVADMRVAEGVRVNRGTHLASVSNTGPYAGGCPHIHLAAWGSSSASGAGLPIEALSGQPVRADASILGQSTGFTELRAFADPTIALTAGDRGSFVVTTRWAGPPLQCGYLALRVRGDGSVPARFVDAPGGWWPNSAWVSTQGVKVEGCVGELRTGDVARFRVPVKAPLLERPGTAVLGRFAVVYDHPTAGFWAPESVTLAIAVQSPWARLRFVSQSITPQAVPGQPGGLQMSVSLRNGTGHALAPGMNVRLATGGPETPRDAATSGGFNRLLLREPCDPSAVCRFENVGTVPSAQAPARKVLQLHVVVDDAVAGYHDTWERTGGVFLIEKVGVPPSRMAPGLAEVDFRWAGQVAAAGPPGSRTHGSITVAASGWGCVATTSVAPQPFRLGVPGDRPSPYLDPADSRILAGGTRVAVDGGADGMLCSGDVVTVAVPVRIPSDAMPGTTLQVPLSAVTDAVEWDPGMLSQRVLLPIDVTS